MTKNSNQSKAEVKLKEVFMISKNKEHAGQEKLDVEMQRFILAEQEKVKFQGHVHNITDACWDKCVDKVGSKLDSRTETCIVNCVERFIDSSNLVTNRFTQIGQN